MSDFFSNEREMGEGERERERDYFTIREVILQGHKGVPRHTLVNLSKCRTCCCHFPICVHSHKRRDQKN